MKIEHVYVCGSGQDLGYTRCCVASIRRWYPEIPITLLKDETVGAYDTRELEQAWDVSLWESGAPLPGGGWAKLEPLFGGERQGCLILDSDVVLLGRVIERLEAACAEFVVESAGGWEPQLARDYFEPEVLENLDPQFRYPGYTFNPGALATTSGVLSRELFEPWVRFGPAPPHTRDDVFGQPGIQGLLNYVLLREARAGRLRLERISFMLWGWSRLPVRGPRAVRPERLTDEEGLPYVVHWHGRKHKLLLLQRNRRLLRHYERTYYERVPSGRRKRIVRTVRLLGAIASGSDTEQVGNSYSRPLPAPAPVRPIDEIFVLGTRHDLRYTRCCVASIRRWYPQMPITLVKDESSGPYDTRELEAVWNVRVLERDDRFRGMWTKLVPLLETSGRRRCLILDSDIVFAGPVLETLEALDADFVVEGWGGRPVDWKSADRGYFDLEALEQFDPEFEFPGYTFNAGHIVATTGLLRIEDYEALVDFEGTRRPRHDFFESYDQGVLNYLLLKKAQLGELTLERAPFMKWGGSRLPRRGPRAMRLSRLTDDSPYRYLVHWSTRKSKFFIRMPNGRLLRHFERHYYSRVPHGRLRRALRIGRLMWRVLTRRESARVGWNPR